MPRAYESSLDGSGLRIALVRARFNAEITESMEGQALKTLREHGVADDDILLAQVPGAFEIPAIGYALFENEGIDAVIGLACVIRGETSHYDYVCKAVTEGVLNVGLEVGRPFIFGILTTENAEQARARSGDGEKNKGRDVALAAIEMVRLQKNIATDRSTADGKAESFETP
ncbi:MAG: 6,7-dimethyl-8-ribityllumazine synthase [Planctomycetota bacterium]